MDLEQFFAELGKCAEKFEWYFTPECKCIRGSRKDIDLSKVPYNTFCPITALCYERTGEFNTLGDWLSAALLLKLANYPYILLEAADREDETKPSALRERMLNAVGLSEPKLDLIVPAGDLGACVQS